MKDPHNYRSVGYSMILIAVSLTVIAVLHISIGDNVLYGDSILRLKTMEFNNCVENNFEGEDCKRYTNSIVAQECIENRDLSSPKCFKYQTWIQSDIFEECRANRDTTSIDCLGYKDIILKLGPLESEEEISEVESEEIEEESVLEVTGETHIVSVPSGSSSPGCEESLSCFIPSSITVNVGDTVSWSNDDTAAHTVTSGNLAEGGPDGIFDSSIFMSNAVFDTTFNEAGTFEYFCIVHPWMTGTIEVI